MEESFVWTARLSELYQITSAELVGILKVVVAFGGNTDERLVVLTDSLNSYLWLKQGLENNYLVHLIMEVVANIDVKTVTAQWILSQVGIVGNDEANELANRRCHLMEISAIKMTYADAYFAISH